MEERDVIIKQIIVVTDGQSNVGGDPVEAAAKAYESGIIVNTIGIVDSKNRNDKALDEIIDIARAGGGSYEYTCIEQLFQTMQGLTYKTINQTLKDVVSQHLQEMIGEDISSMEPKSRNKILNYIDGFSDDVGLRACILLDSSGSMSNKIHIAKYSSLNLIHSLEGRRGKTELAVLAFPGDRLHSCTILHRFGDSTERLEKSIYNLDPKGGTPTALAIGEASKLINRKNLISFQKDEVIDVDEYNLLY